jgi:hypothetical protein
LNALNITRNTKEKEERKGGLQRTLVAIVANKTAYTSYYNYCR